MSKWNELKALAEIAHTEIIRSHGWEGTIEEADMLGADERYLLAASPAAIVELLAERDALLAERDALIKAVEAFVHDDRVPNEVSQEFAEVLILSRRAALQGEQP